MATRYTRSLVLRPSKVTCVYVNKSILRALIVQEKHKISGKARADKDEDYI
jgi:hypothetical protein